MMPWNRIVEKTRARLLPAELGNGRFTRGTLLCRLFACLLSSMFHYIGFQCKLLRYKESRKVYDEYLAAKAKCIKLVHAVALCSVYIFGLAVYDASDSGWR